MAGQTREAATLLIQAVGAQPKSAEAWDLLTFALNRLREPQAAAVVGERAVRLKPESATIQFNTGLAYYRSGQMEKAAAHLREAARLNTTQPEPLLYLAAATKDKSLLEEAVKRFPDHKELKTTLAMLNNDVDEDGTPENEAASTQHFVITSGLSKATYLDFGRPNENMTGVNGGFAALGENGDRFFYANLPSRQYVLFHMVGNGFVPVLNGAGEAAFDLADRELVVNSINPTTAAGVTIRYSWENGAAVQVVWNYVIPDNPSKGYTPPPPDPLKDLVDLFVAVIRWEPQAFASEATYKAQSSSSLPGKVKQFFLLPNSNGSYRLELEADGAPWGSAQAWVDQQWRIEKLDWK